MGGAAALTCLENICKPSICLTGVKLSPVGTQGLRKLCTTFQGFIDTYKDTSAMEHLWDSLQFLEHVFMNLGAHVEGSHDGAFCLIQAG